MKSEITLKKYMKVHDILARVDDIIPKLGGN